MTSDFPALLDRIADGDETALAVLYASLGGPVYSLTLHILHDAALAQEATQDTFLKVWQRPRGWDSGKGQFVSWLLTMARYTAIDCLRREVRRAGKDVELDENLAADPGDGPSQHDLDRLHALMGRLPDEQRVILELAYFKGMKHTELAEALGLPLGTVKTRLRLGLQKLRGLLAE